MRVREIMSSPAITCRTQDTLEQAARLLWEHDCGILPVLDKDGRVGSTITDRDICMGAYTRGRRLADLHVADSMSDRLVTCRADDDVAAAAALMTEHQVRRLVVVERDGRIAGLLSLNDLARAAPRDATVGREALRVMTAVCQKQTAQASPSGPVAEAPPRPARTAHA